MAPINLGKSDQSTISLDLQTLLSTRLLIQASSGGGKSHTIRRILEQSHGIVQQIVIEPEGEYSTLREKFDYVIAGTGGDAPADMKSAKLLARKLLELEVSAICDISNLRKHERLAFVRVFLDSLIGAPKKLRHPALVVIDEADQFCPQHGQAESANSVIDLCARGRKRGLCAVLATQRLSKLHKDACAELQNKMIGRTSLDIDQKRAADELGLIGKDNRIALRNLQPGDFHIYGPALLDNGEQSGRVIQFHVGQVKTKHPEIGMDIEDIVPTPSDKVKEILGQLGDLPEVAAQEAREIGDLQREITDLKRKLRTAEKERPEPKPCGHEQVIQQLKEQLNTEQHSNQILSQKLSKLKLEIEKGKSSIVNKLKELIELSAGIIETEEYQNAKIKSPSHKIINSNIAETANFNDDNPDINQPMQRILNALLSLEMFGIEHPAKAMVAAHSRYSPGSGGFNNLLSRLRTSELIDYPQPGCVCLMDAGRAEAEAVNPITSIEDLHQSWLAIIKNSSQKRILASLINIYPDSISREELAARNAFSPGSGGFNNNLSKLKTLGAIDYPARGMVRASDLLFPKGLEHACLH